MGAPDGGFNLNMEIARSFSRKISLTSYGFPYETIDLFASYKSEIEDDATPEEKKRLSQKLELLAQDDVEQQEARVRGFYEENKRNIEEETQRANGEKARKASYARRKETEKIVDRLNTDPKFKKEYEEKVHEGLPF